MPRGTIKATVLIETILAAFEMDEILYELREHSAGLNAGPLGLHLQRDQEARPPARVRAPRPLRGDDGRAVHVRLHGAAREDVPCARRARDGRHGGVHPVAPRPRGERGRAGEGARGQGARGGPGLRRHVGRPPRPRAGRDGDLRPRPRRPPEPGRAAARRCLLDRGRPARRRRDAGRDHDGRACTTTSRWGSSTSPPGCRDPVPSRSST